MKRLDIEEIRTSSRNSNKNNNDNNTSNNSGGREVSMPPDSSSPRGNKSHKKYREPPDFRLSLLISNICILLTFGMILPLLGLVGLVSLVFETYFQQLLLGRFQCINFAVIDSVTAENDLKADHGV